MTTTLKVKSNKKTRTFTIRRYLANKLILKYRTIEYSKQAFESMLNNTCNDWECYLNTSSDYYRI